MIGVGRCIGKTIKIFKKTFYIFVIVTFFVQVNLDNRDIKKPSEMRNVKYEKAQKLLSDIIEKSEEALSSKHKAKIKKSALKDSKDEPDYQEYFHLSGSIGYSGKKRASYNKEDLRTENDTVSKLLRTIRDVRFANKNQVNVSDAPQKESKSSHSKPTKIFRKKPPANVRVSHDIDRKEISLNKTQLEDIKKKIQLINKKQEILNERIFGKVNEDVIVFVVQVHKRLENLRYLVSSLSETRYINNSLVIFSHDYWDDEINTFIRNISSFRVMQIFFPYSIQLYPTTFPGRHPQDCPVKSNITTGNKCKNVNWKDTYGNYREPPLSQIKHHWWWKLNRVFNGLSTTKYFTGDVLFLEEDHYVAPDIIHMIYKLREYLRLNSIKVHVLGLGSFKSMANQNKFINNIESGYWAVNKYNIGFAFNRTVWNKINSASKTFCNYDDYNWDWSLANIMNVQRLQLLTSTVSRVHHTGQCSGTHSKVTRCSFETVLKTMLSRIDQAKYYWYPNTLVLSGRHTQTQKSVKNFGGWSDYRDRDLCSAVGNGTDNESLIERLNSYYSY